MDVKYDFKSEANSHKWDKLLIESLERILSEVHLNLTLTDAAAYYIQELILSKCLYPICTKPSTDLETVEDLIKQKLPPPLNQWAITESRAYLKTQPTQKNNKGISQKKPQFLLPYNKLKNLIFKEFFQIPWSDELENVILLIVGCIEFLCVDVVRLIGSYVKNLKSVEVKVEDVKTALSVDKVLLDLFEISRDVNETISQLNTGTENLGPESKTLKYTNLVKMIIAEERQNVRNIQMIIYVFISPLEKLENVPKEETPLVGDCFLEFAEQKSLGPYLTFAQHIAEKQEEYMTHYCSFLASKPIQEYFQKTKKELGYCVAEVYRYVLPRLMFNLVSHAANYYERLDMLLKTSPGDQDRYELEQTLSCMKPVLIELNKMAERLPKREVYLRFVPKTIDSAATMRVQELVQNLSGIDEETRKRLYHSVAEIIMEGEWFRISGNDRKSRVVFLLDGWILCCRKKGNQIRVKESFRMREIEIVDKWGVVAGAGMGDPEENGKKAEEMALSFHIVMSETSSSSSSHGKPYEREYLYAFETQDDKQKWMVAMLSIHSRGTLERMLDKYIAEEEKKQPLRFPAPDKYCFAEPDEKEGDVNIITDSKSGVSKVKEATLPKLVERLTYHIHADHAYIEDFFTTYRSFCEPMELFNLLNIRFNIPDIEPTEEEKQTYSLVEPPSIRKFRKEYAHPVQSRVLNVLRYWINNHYDDFKKDPALLSAVDTFIQDVSENKKWKNYCSSIKKSLSNQALEIKKQPDISHTTDAPRIEWHLAIPRDESTYNLLSLHPLEIARQITLIESEMFRKVTLSELTNFGCCSIKDRDQKRRMFPNVVAWQNFNNRISYWFTYTVLDTPVIEERVALLVRGWEIAQALEELNNFSGVLHVISGLNYSSVSRLKLTHEKLPKETKEQKHQLISKYIDSNLKFYKDALKTTNPPLVPYLGNTFTNVLHIEDSAKTHTSSTLINFSKCRLISSQCRTIMMYQPMPYNLEPEPSIQKYLTSQDPVGTHTESEWADKLHAMSLALEPRDSNFTAIKSSSKAERKYNISLLKNPVKKPSQSTGINVANKLCKVSSASKSGITDLVNSSDKVTTYTRPTMPTSPPVVPNNGRSRSSASHSSSQHESSSPNPPSTPKPLTLMGQDVLPFVGVTKNFATIGSPIGLVEQQTKQHLQQQHRKQMSMRGVMRHRTSSGDNSSCSSLSTSGVGGGRSSLLSSSSSVVVPPYTSSNTNITLAHHQMSHSSSPHPQAPPISPFTHRLSTSSVSPDNQSSIGGGGGSSFSMCSSFPFPSPLSTANSNSTLVTETTTTGGSPGYGCSSSNISTASQSQHSSVSDLTSSPGSCCSSYKMNKNQASYFFNCPMTPTPQSVGYGTIDSLSSSASHGYYSGASSQHHFNSQNSPSSPGHMTHPLPRSPSAATKVQGAAPPIPPRKPLNNELSLNNSRVSISGIEDVQTPPGTLSPDHKNTCPSPEKLPPRTPFGVNGGGSSCHRGLSPAVPASSTLPRAGVGGTSSGVDTDRLRQLPPKNGGSVTTVTAPCGAYNKTISSININNNNNNYNNNDFYSSPRRSMIESYSAVSNNIPAEVAPDNTNSSSPPPVPPMPNGVASANRSSHAVPPKLVPRRPDSSSMYSIDHITSSPSPAVHPPEIPARTYKSPAMSAS